MLSFIKQTKYLICILFSLIIFTTGCDNGSSSDNDEPNSGISYFAFHYDLNPVLGDQNAIGKIESGNIYVTVPLGTDVTSLKPTFNFGGESVVVGTASQNSGVTAQDFTFPVSYVLNVSTEEKLYYTVFVNIAKENSKRITAFAFMEKDNPDLDNDELPGSNNYVLTIPEDESITGLSITMPRNVDITDLKPQISYSGESMWPETNIAQNFSTPVRYTITAEDGSERVYTITVNLEKSDTKEITKFQFLRSENRENIKIDIDSVINNETKEITIKMPTYTELESLKPHIEIIGKNISPTISEAQNFSGPVIYTVTAQDGSTENYTVNVLNAKNTDNELKVFKILAAENVGIDEDIIVEVKRPIVNVVIPSDSTAEVTSLVPNVEEHTGVRIELVGDPDYDFTTPLDFSKDPYGSTKISFKVFAEDETVKPKIYKIEVEKQKNSANKITEFAFLQKDNETLDDDIVGVITDNYIVVEMPYSANLNGLIPYIDYQGEITPGDNVPQDFTKPISYVVEAADGKQRTYTIEIDQKNITPKIKSFIFKPDLNNNLSQDVVGVIENNQINVTLPAGTTETWYRPFIITSADTVKPAAGEIVNFSTMQTYTALLDSGLKEEYQVNVNVAASDDCKIDYFAFEKAYNPNLRKDAVATSINETTGDIEITVSLGADISSLIPTIAYKGKRISPSSGVKQNFLANQIYKVTSQNDAEKNYTVKVYQEKNNIKQITHFAFRKTDNSNLDKDYIGEIDHASRTINVTMPFGTDLFVLYPEIEYSAKSISPDSKAFRDFTLPVEYTLTAEDESAKTYTVIVNSRVPNFNVVLESLVLTEENSNENLLSGFNSNKLYYKVGIDRPKYSLKAVPQNNQTTLKINGEDYDAGANYLIEPTTSDTTISIKVATKDGKFDEEYKINLFTLCKLKLISLKVYGVDTELITFDPDTDTYDIISNPNITYSLKIFSYYDEQITVNGEMLNGNNEHIINYSNLLERYEISVKSSDGKTEKKYFVNILEFEPKITSLTVTEEGSSTNLVTSYDQDVFEREVEVNLAAQTNTNYELNLTTNYTNAIVKINGVIIDSINSYQFILDNENVFQQYDVEVSLLNVNSKSNYNFKVFLIKNVDRDIRTKPDIESLPNVYKIYGSINFIGGEFIPYQYGGQIFISTPINSTLFNDYMEIFKEKGISQVDGTIGFKYLSQDAHLNSFSKLNYIKKISFYNSEISDFSGLSSIKRIDSISFTTSGFGSFTGLENISTLESLTFVGCDGLNDFTGLENLRSINSIFILECDGLNNFIGLENLKIIKHKLEVSSCNNLISLSGMNSVEEIGEYNVSFDGGLILRDNNSLESVNMPNLNMVYNHFFIKNNSMLDINLVNQLFDQLPVKPDHVDTSGNLNP